MLVYARHRGSQLSTKTMSSGRQHSDLSFPAPSSDLLEPAAKRRRLNIDISSRQSDKQYENVTAYGQSRNHFGDVINASNVHFHGQPAGCTDAQEFDNKDAENAAELMEALAFEQMDARLETISKAHAKTCQWLFATEEYRTWRDPDALHAHHGFFWIKGKPGAGKSTLMKCAKKFAESEHDDLVISFFFNARGEELEQSAEGMYRSLLYQLLEQKPSLSSAMVRDKKRTIPQRWSAEVLKDILEAAVRALGNTTLTCYIDALDECDDDHAKEMLESFESFGESAVEANIGFRVLLSSRHYPHITIEKKIEMTLEGQEDHQADIADYVRCKLKIGKSKMAIEIRDEIRVRASGVFLWVVLVIRILNDCDARGKTHLLRKRLEDIPDGLSRLFEEILQRRRDDLDDTLLIYQWILFAKRPLKREELYFAVATNFEDDDIEDWDSDEITAHTMDRFLLNSSKGLAQLTRGKHPTVQFIHESVKEYLLNTGLEHLNPDLGKAPLQLSHDALWRCCQHYLRRSEAALLPKATDGKKRYMSRQPEDISLLRARVAATHPFLGYATDNILYHADLAHLRPQSRKKFVTAFPHELWRRLYNMTCQYHERRSVGTSPWVYTCVAMGASDLAISEIQKGPSYATKRFAGENHPSLLGAATTNGDHRLMQLLLKYGADPHAPISSTSKVDCLTFAIKKRNAAMVQIIIEGGADLHRKAPRAHSSQCYLGLALNHGNYNRDVVEIILRHEPYSIPTFWPDVLTEALKKFVSMGHDTPKQMLLAKLDMISADLTIFGSEPIPEIYINAFVAACCNEDLVLIKRFLDRDTPGLKDYMPRVFGEAVCQGHLEVVRLLLDHGCDVDLTLRMKFDDPRAEGIIFSSDETEGTALSFGVLVEEDDIVRLLLERKAGINRRDAYGETLLHTAIRRGSCSIVRALLDFGFDPNMRTKHADGFQSAFGACFGTALHCASCKGQADIARLLIQNAKTNPDALDQNGCHAVCLAAERNHADCVQVLLESEIPIRHLNCALQKVWAGRCTDKKELVGMLMAKGATSPETISSPRVSDCRTLLMAMVGSED